MVMSVTIIMTCTLSSYEGTYYYSIVDMNTLASSLAYQFIVLYVVFIRISHKMDKKMAEYDYEQEYNSDPTNMTSEDGSAVGFSPTALV